MFAIDVHEWGMANLIEYHRTMREEKLLPPVDPAAPAA